MWTEFVRSWFKVKKKVEKQYIETFLYLPYIYLQGVSYVIVRGVFFNDYGSMT